MSQARALSLGEALVKGLRARGVGTVFGIPGVHTVELYRGLAGSGIRHITPRHEQGAGFMADGYARVSGEPGVALVITGPGLTNILTPMAQARADSVPMLVVSGVNHRESLGLGLGHLHELPDQHLLAKAVALLSEHVTDPTQLGPALDAVFRPFTAGRPGPTHIQIPIDCAPLAAVEPGIAPLTLPPAPDQSLIATASERLATARTPLILAGGGAKNIGPALRTLAERLDAPVVQTVNGRGVLFGHPLSVAASPSLQAIRKLIEASDVVLGLGTELGPTDYDMYATGSMARMADLIRVDRCAEQLNRHPADILLQCDAGAAVRALVSVLPQTTAGRDGATRAADARNAAWDEISPEYQGQVRILTAIRDAAPRSILVGDSTQPIYAGNLYYDHDRPGGWFNAATGYGALGYAIPAAIGAAIAAPGTRVLCLTGDGGAQFSLPELMTAVDEALSVTVIIWNNSGYLEIARAMEAAGVGVVGCSPSPPNFHSIAEAMGVAYRQCPARPDAIGAAVAETGSLRGPALIEISAQQ